MGQKVNPIGLRTALTKNWESRWFPSKAFGGKNLFGEWLHEDLAIRKFIKEKFARRGDCENPDRAVREPGCGSLSPRRVRGF